MNKLIWWFFKTCFKFIREFRIESNNKLLKIENILLYKYFRYEIIRKHTGGNFEKIH